MYTLKDQKASLNSLEDLLSMVFIAGKHKGRSYTWVREHDPSYLYLALNSKFNGPDNQNFVKYLKEDKANWYYKALEQTRLYYIKKAEEIETELNQYCGIEK